MNVPSSVNAAPEGDVVIFRNPLADTPAGMSNRITAINSVKRFMPILPDWSLMMEKYCTNA
jgi:hypothetical protein